MRETLMSSNDARVAIDLGFNVDDDGYKQHDERDNNNYHDNSNVSSNNDNDNEDDDEDSWYGEYYKSIRTDTGLEIGCIITWPNLNDDNDYDDYDDEQNTQYTQQDHKQQKQQLTISTCLPETSIAPMFHGTQWAGTRLWRASIVATKYILELYRLSNVFNWNKNTIVIELGCGLGVPGMIIHNKINCYTILTDKGDLIEQIQNNLYTNFPTTTSTTVPSSTTTTNINDTSTTTSSTIQVQSLDWSIEGISELKQTINKIQQRILLSSSSTSSTTTPTIVQQQQQQQQQQPTSSIVILCCDCIYEPLYGTSWKQLLLCQNELLRIYPTAYVLTSVERRKFDGIDQYLSLATNTMSSSSVAPNNDAITKVERITNIPFDYPSEIEMYRFYGKT
jgi:Lysine methyltransferase